MQKLKKKIIGEDIEWTTFLQVFKKKKKKLRWFQTKICYRMLVRNSLLKIMGMVENYVCNFCVTEEDTFFHFMCQCEHTQSFWVRFEMCSNCARFSINSTLILFGHDGKKNDACMLWLYAFCMHNYLCVNVDWTNLSLHLKLL